jgi:hypothetical protein
MVFARQLGYMAPESLEYSDSFPERHVEDQHNATTDHPQTHPDESHPPTSMIAPPRVPGTRPESPDGYAMRLRYSEAADLLRQELEESKKPPVVWDYTYDSVRLPPPGIAKTKTMRRLSCLPIQRAWRRRSNSENPELQEPRVVEAMMIYERGELMASGRACSRCNMGPGVSRQCVVVSEEISGSCSNCLYDGVNGHCDVRQSTSQAQTREKLDVRPRKSDFMVVLSLIEQTKQPERSNRRPVDAKTRARRIEEAALEVARAAREWGLREEQPEQ